MSKETEAQLELLRGYYNNIGFQTEATRDDILDMLEHDISYLETQNIITCAEDLILSEAAKTPTLSVSEAREKAEGILRTYQDTVMHFPYIDTQDGKCIGTGYMTHNSAKRCALHAIAISLQFASETGAANLELIKTELEKL